MNEPRLKSVNELLAETEQKLVDSMKPLENMQPLQELYTLRVEDLPAHDQGASRYRTLPVPNDGPQTLKWNPFTLEEAQAAFNLYNTKSPLHHDPAHDAVCRMFSTYMHEMSQIEMGCRACGFSGEGFTTVTHTMPGEPDDYDVQCPECGSLETDEIATALREVTSQLDAEGADRLEAALRDLVGQVEQARDGMGIYANSPSMAAALDVANKLLGPPPPPVELDPNRCAICGWTLAETTAVGCRRGNCSLRPPPLNYYDPARAKAERRH